MTYKYVIIKSSDDVIITQKTFETIDNDSNFHWFQQLIQDDKIIKEWNDEKEEAGEIDTSEEFFDIMDFLPCEDEDEQELIKFLDDNNIQHDDGEETEQETKTTNAYGVEYKYYYQELRYKVEDLTEEQKRELEKTGFDIIEVV